MASSPSIATDTFMFGTLLEEDGRNIVFRGDPGLVTARLDSCQRRRLPESYPVLVRAVAAVEGLVAIGLDDHDCPCIRNSTDSTTAPSSGNLWQLRRSSTLETVPGPGVTTKDQSI